MAELAARSGVSVRSIGDIERGATLSPQRSTLEALAAALRLAPAERARLLAAGPPQRIGRRPVPERDGAATGLIDGPLVGRVHERARLAGLLSEGRGAVVVFGAAGVGKSALVARAVEDSGRRSVVVDFTRMHRSALAPLATVRMVLDAAVVSPAGARRFGDLVGAWRSFSAERRPVLVLEALVDEAPARLLLAIDESSTVVITSRTPLAGVSGVERLHVPPLSTEDAVLLLRGRVDLLREEELAEVALLCDRLPLALDLVAERLSGASRATVRRVLLALRSPERRLDVLRSGRRSLRGALQTSYDALGPETSELLVELCRRVEPTFDVAQAAAAMDGDRADIESGLDRLVDRGLAEAFPAATYRIPELIRLFAAAPAVPSHRRTV